ncbi:MAG: hypothetical protein KDC68_09415 [Gelidibacter sp.]|nr:hypothetical protein [Gelidibacter sp.]
MKRAIAIALASIFTFNILGNYALLMVHKYEVKRELISFLKTGVADAQLTLIKITSKNKKDLYWKEAHEFKYKGEMYDVVKTEKKDANTTIYYCITDSKERQLLTDLENQTDKNKTSKNSKINTSKVVIKIIPKEEFDPNLPVLPLKNKTITSQYLSFYHSVKIDIESPPPNLV